MTSKIPPSEERAMKSEFLQLDLDGDGNISTEELEKMLRSMQRKLNATEADIKAALKDIDRNGDGTIDLNEYFMNSRNKVQGDLIHRALVQRSRIRKEFASFDTDNSGFISKEEFIQVIQKRGMKQITPERLALLIKSADVDGNGQIDYEEFVVLMTK